VTNARSPGIGPREFGVPADSSHMARRLHLKSGAASVAVQKLAVVPQQELAGIPTGVSSSRESESGS
jgi:hypothetical protein